MKKILLLVLFTNCIYSQDNRVGVNTYTPKTSMDVNGKTDASGVSLSTDMTGLQAPRLTRLEITNKGTIYGTDQKGALVYITDTAGGDTNGPRANITSIGYYYFDGSDWIKVALPTKADNGLTMSTENNVQLGGTLLKNTEIVTAGFSTSFTGTGKLGVGEVVPTTKLHVKDVTNPLRLEGVQTAAISDEILTISSTGVVNKNSIDNILSQKSVPTPAVWYLTSNISNFLNGVIAGTTQNTPMTLLKNDIAGLTFNSATNTITFTAGLYQMNYIYEAEHNNTGCTISSYIVDFPDTTPAGAATTRRIHSTGTHSQGTLSNHGGTVSYTAKLNEGQIWQIKLGRGQSGNCSGTGNVLMAKSSQFSIVRLGD